MDLNTCLSVQLGDRRSRVNSQLIQKKRSHNKGPNKGKFPVVWAAKASSAAFGKGPICVLCSRRGEIARERGGIGESDRFVIDQSPVNRGGGLTRPGRSGRDARANSTVCTALGFGTKTTTRLPYHI
ncbi:unnamed protein product, partial [Iphiclides podalirius]